MSGDSGGADGGRGSVGLMAGGGGPGTAATGLCGNALSSFQLFRSVW